MVERKIIKIAEFVFENYQKYADNEIIEKLKINTADFILFRQVFGSDYAEYMDVNGKKIFRLTSKGAQLYLDLKGKEQQDFLNKILVIATVFLAIIAFVQTVKLFI